MGPYTVFKTPPSTPKPAEPPVFDSPKKVVSPPPVQPPPQQIDKSVSTWHLSDGSVSGFFRNAVNKVQNAHSSLDEHLARWFGLNQSKYQWALDDYYENKELIAGMQFSNCAKMHVESPLYYHIYRPNIGISKVPGLLKGTVVWISRDRLACNLLLLIAAVKQVWLWCIRLTKSENELAKLAIVTLAAGVLALGSVGVASAAKSGGRVGGQAFRSSAPRSSPRINSNSRTNIYVNPPLAPPLVGGMGMVLVCHSMAAGAGRHFRSLHQVLVLPLLEVDSKL
ncbi:hypothetical protein GH714_003810 [Hevea brasiliensis]|uniref:Uncharacterized protein n=1 Tax=Hevea brasiliensis TaxID=3981 RepID=A0A6A6MBH0_HEVBR|nr:hypothetical protein GH714_003810 [Hevea brasiliensis]